MDLLLQLSSMAPERGFVSCLAICAVDDRHVCRQVKLANPDVVSYGGLTTVTNYHLIPKNESVVDSVFMHDNFASSPNRDESAMVVVTNDHVYSLADD